MSLSSLADAPTLPKSAPGSPFHKSNSKSRPSSKKLNDQSAIDALFQDDDEILGGKSLIENRNISPVKETSNSLKNLDRGKGKGLLDAQKTYSLLLSDLYMQKGEEQRGLPSSKQASDFSSKTKDPNDVLSNFLLESLSEQKVYGNKLLSKEPIHSLINKNNRGDENTLKISTSSFPSTINDLKNIKEAPKVGRSADFGFKIKDPNDVLASFLADSLAEKNMNMSSNKLRNERGLSPLKDRSVSPLKDRSVSPNLRDRNLSPLKERGRDKGEENLQNNRSTSFLSSPEMNVLTFEEPLKGRENHDFRSKIKDPNDILAGFLAESLPDKTMDKVCAQRNISPFKDFASNRSNKEDHKERNSGKSFLASIDITSEKVKDPIKFGQGIDFRYDKNSNENSCPTRQINFQLQESSISPTKLNKDFKLENIKKSQDFEQLIENKHHKSQTQDLSNVAGGFVAQKLLDCKQNNFKDDKKYMSETITLKQNMQPSTTESVSTSVHFHHSTMNEGDACSRAEEDNDLSSDEDDKLDVLQDILSILPGDDVDTTNIVGISLANNVDDTHFGDYRPSFLSRPESRQRRILTSFFPSNDDTEGQEQGTLKEITFSTNQTGDDNVLHQSTMKDDVPSTLSNEISKHQSKSISEDISRFEHKRGSSDSNVLMTRNFSPDETFLSPLKVNMLQQSNNSFKKECTLQQSANFITKTSSKENLLCSILNNTHDSFKCLESDKENVTQESANFVGLTTIGTNNNGNPVMNLDTIVQPSTHFISENSNKERTSSPIDFVEFSVLRKGNVMQQITNLEMSSKNEKAPFVKEDISTSSVAKDNLMLSNINISTKLSCSTEIINCSTKRGDDNFSNNNQTYTLPCLKPNIVSQGDGILTEQMTKKDLKFQPTNEKESTNVHLSSMSLESDCDKNLNKVPLGNTTSNMSALERDTTLVVENQRLRNENMSLREEIMKIETEKLMLEKELLNKELHFEAHVVKQTTTEREEAQRIANELRMELTSVKQNLTLNEGKLDAIKKTHAQEIETLKNIHTLELEAKDQQLSAERTLVEEKKTAVEAFSQLLHKADEWSTKIEKLYQGMGCVKDNHPKERPEWISNIERLVCERESSLQVLEKRSTKVCAQLEKVFVMLELARKDMDKLQFQEEQVTKTTCDPLQTIQEKPNDQSINLGAAPCVNVQNPTSQDEQTLITNFLEEKKKLEAEKASVFQMKEHLSQVDSTLRKELLGHASRMQAEEEDMARRKQELEQAKDIATEIASEVENSRRELEMYKIAFGKIIPEAIGSGMHDELLQKANMANKGFIFNQRRGFERTEPIRNWEPYQHQYSDIRMNSISDVHLLNRMGRSPQQTVVVGVDGQDIYYIKAQENFLTEAEKALEDMMQSPLY